MYEPEQTPNFAMKIWKVLWKIISQQGKMIL